jgi:3,4-dihydroxy 2-butanone 4-phosphate synthase/GTP cyclohydrolase II
LKRVPIEMGACESNLFYLQTKKDKLGHMLELDETAAEGQGS